MAGPDLLSLLAKKQAGRIFQRRVKVLDKDTYFCYDFSN